MAHACCAIYRNTITNELSPTSFVSFKGIFVSSVDAVNIKQNVIEENNSTSIGLISFSGIRVEDGNKTIISDNVINGISTAYGQPESAGIFLAESNSCRLSCNTLDNINKGIFFKASLNTDAAFLSYNNMNTHVYGLLLGKDVKIGGQNTRNNTWAGSSGQVEGFMDYPMYNPTNPAHTSFVMAFQFLVQNTDVSSNIRWANPRLVGSDSDASNKWFDQDGTAETFPECTNDNDPKERTVSDDAVINGTFRAYKGYTATIWEAQFHTFERLYHLPELRPDNSAALSWYNAAYGTTLGQLYLAYDAVVNFGSSTTAPLESAADNVAVLLQELQQKNTEWALTQDEAEKTQIAQDIAVLNIAALDAQNNYNTLANEVLNEQNAQKQALLEQLNALTLNTVYEENLRQVLVVLLESDFANLEYSADQQATLEAIAAQCRLEGSYGVVLARKALGTIGDTYAANDDCPDLSAPRSPAQKTLVAGAAIVYPNPAEDAVFIQWNSNVSEATVVLHDALGHNVRYWEIKKTNQFKGDLTGLLPGVYQVVISINRQGIETHPLLIIK